MSKHHGSPGHCSACKVTIDMQAIAPRPRVLNRALLGAMPKAELVELVFEFKAIAELAGFHAERTTDLLSRAPRLEP